MVTKCVTHALYILKWLPASLSHRKKKSVQEKLGLVQPLLFKHNGADHIQLHVNRFWMLFCWKNGSHANYRFGSNLCIIHFVFPFFQKEEKMQDVVIRSFDNEGQKLPAAWCCRFAFCIFPPQTESMCSQCSKTLHLFLIIQILRFQTNEVSVGLKTWGNLPINFRSWHIAYNKC